MQQLSAAAKAASVVVAGRWQQVRDKESKIKNSK
jgi:hypothetical protein